MKKKLTPPEIDAITDKIRNNYNHLIVTYMLSPSLKDSFEKRLFQVRQAGVNPERFLRDEILNIKQIEQSEKEKINKTAHNHRIMVEKQNNGKDNVKKDFADRVIEKIMKQIKKYPELFIHDNANPEIKKLFGTLIDFDTRHWTNYDRISKKYRAIRYDLSYVRLENSINDFSRIYKDDVPSRLIRYKTMLSSPFSRISDIEREEKLAILEAAVLINNLIKALSDFDDMEHINTSDRDTISEMKFYLENVKKDFRLNDLMEFTK